TIYDRNGKPLAVSATAETVYLNPYETGFYKEDPALIASGLSEILGAEREAILTMLSDTGARYKTVKRKIEAELAAQVRRFLTENNIKSVHLEEDTKRYYPRGRLASQLIGFVGTDNTGLYGVEATYDEYLTGTNGRVVRLKNGSGTEMLFTDYENYFDARDGDEVTLTIDATIQHYMEKYVEQGIIDYDVQKGAAAIAMDPKTGEILGMVSYGNFDLNNAWGLPEEVEQELDAITDSAAQSTARSNALYAQWRNKALSDTYEPGSVFKIITLAMALEEGVVDMDSTFYCGGSVDFLGGSRNCWKTAGHGTQTLAEAMQNSCNVALINIGFKVGADAFYRYVDAFGFFAKTGLDLPGEAGGNGTPQQPYWWSDSVFTDKDNPAQLASASFGQTFNITPIQLVTAVSAAVNGGTLYTPHVVSSIRDADGNVVLDNRPQAVRQVVSSETSAQVREILESVVRDGTGGNAYVKGYRIGGKTGTSTKTAQEAAGASREYIVSFCGVAPANDPQIVLLVLFDTPSADTGIYISGGVMAAPVVGNILSDVLPYIGVVPEYTEEELRALNTQVPKLTDRSVEQAQKDLRDKGLQYEVVGDGAAVTDQLPAANALVSPGTKVILYAGAARPETESVTVPNLYGRGYLNAKTLLEDAGLFIRTTGAAASGDSVVVSAQSQTAGEEAAFGTVVEVTLTDVALQGFY
ncbi:MAG: PASTA domain-containing protein, partial [Oscillospiraceae bacterium]|nr:PASTA domain-containing protein [Oscillospiraceae bacterium]